MGSSNINFMVGISFNKDVVLCEQYFGSITTTKFAKTVENMVPRGSKLKSQSNFKMNFNVWVSSAKCKVVVESH